MLYGHVEDAPHRIDHLIRLRELQEFAGGQLEYRERDPNGSTTDRLDEMLRDFDTGRMSTSGPVFDLEKLGWLNGEYIRAMSEEELTERLIEHWAYRSSIGAEPNPAGDGPLYDWIFANGGFADERVTAFILKTMPLMQTRIKTLEEYAPVARCRYRSRA